MTTTKCEECSKKIGLLDMITCKCRCGSVFCKNHRLDHNCSYDYQSEYKNSHKMVKLQEKKVDKI